LSADIGPDLGRLAGWGAVRGRAQASEDVPLREADHRLLRDLIDFEGLAFASAKRQGGDKAKRRHGFAQPISPEDSRAKPQSADVRLIATV
jgi:hypothetical protein